MFIFTHTGITLGAAVLLNAALIQRHILPPRTSELRGQEQASLVSHASKNVSFIRTTSWVTSLAALFPLMLVICSGIFYEKKKIFKKMSKTFSKDDLRLLGALAIACTCMLVFSIFSAFMSGRFIWPLYTALVPIAVVSSQNTKLYQKLMVPMANFCFGDSEGKFRGSL